jgi:hypothetical protein
VDLNVDLKQWRRDISIRQPGTESQSFFLNSSMIGTEILNLTVKIMALQLFVGGPINEKKLHGLSPRANYTDRATAACRRSECQLLRIEGATWSA